MQAPSPQARDQLANLSAPVRECILKAARLCDSSQRQNGGVPAPRPQPDVPIDSMLQLVMSLDAPSALSCLTQMYGAPQSPSQQGPAGGSGVDFDAAASLQNALGGNGGADSAQASGANALGHPFGNFDANLSGLGLSVPRDSNSLGLSLSALTNGGGNSNSGIGNLGASFLAPTPRDAPAPLTTAQGPRSSISQMSSQLRALVEEREPPAATGGNLHGNAPQLQGAGGLAGQNVGSLRQPMSPEEQLASLLAAPSSHGGTGGHNNSASAPINGGGGVGGLKGGFGGLGGLGGFDGNGGGGLQGLSSPLFTGPGGMPRDSLNGSNLGASSFGNFGTKDPLSSLLAGGELQGGVPNLLSSANGRLEGGRDLWPHSGLPAHLLDDRTPRSATL